MLTLKATRGLAESFPINIAGGAIGPFVSKFDIIKIRLNGEGLSYGGFEYRWDSGPIYMKLGIIVGHTGYDWVVGVRHDLVVARFLVGIHI
jgi:hypothetical protein